MRLEVLETIVNPAAIYEGNDGEFLAVREIEPGKSLVAVYRELAAGGYHYSFSHTLYKIS